MAITKKLKIFFLIISIVLLILAYYFFIIAKAKEAENITFGVNFSKEYATFLGLDWRKVYLSLLSDLKVKDIKLLNQWNSIETEKDVFNFEDTDWQLSKASDYGAQIIYVVGMKSGRWPECHLPSWAESLNKTRQQEELLEYIQKTILRYKDNKSIVAWQAENEPFYRFGVCPWYDNNFLKEEVALIKRLDPSRPVIISDSGEQSFWLKAASVGDIIGTTMYRKAWVHITDNLGFYIDFPLPAVTYYYKSQIIKSFFNKKVINIELQAEPWVSSVSDNSLLQEQNSMDVNQFRKNIAYAKKSGFDTFYFWGTEWWYYMKESKNNSLIWDEAKKLF